MPLASSNTGVAITNPLVLYRSLLATKRIDPDPHQHRLALHLQKLYDRLKDYEPTVAYSQRLNQISRAVGSPSARDSDNGEPQEREERFKRQGVWAGLLAQKERRDTLTLTRSLTDHEAALHMDSPKGLMLHGEVGTGKSMLVDLFADCLPNRKKRRWHFNTFMLDTLARLEEFRKESMHSAVAAGVGLPGMPGAIEREDYSLLRLARDLISTSPILFLDEFQLPDRAASKIITNLMTSFFQLGGVLIATSNRMPEELAKASGMEFAPPPSRVEALSWGLGLRRSGSSGGNIGDRFAGPWEFAGFLEVLKARCDVWEMAGKRDYRRGQMVKSTSEVEAARERELEALEGYAGLQAMAPGNTGLGYEQSVPTTKTAAEELSEDDPPSEADLPKHFLMAPASNASPDAVSTHESKLAQLLNNMLTDSLATTSWKPAQVRVYGRTVSIPREHAGTTWWTFSELCSATLGPADYITLASRYHTLILTDVPVLTHLQKNEARRFITLLDALYEARCKLLVSAEAGPDDLFFPETRTAGGVIAGENDSGTAVYAETFSEAYQDATAPFRPNISSYSPSSSDEPDSTHVRFAGVLAEDALEDDPPNRVRRLDPVYGGDYDVEREAKGTDGKSKVDFSRSSAFTGEDERFAYKRARSRLWEMCGEKWWARADEGWHRPLPEQVRRWERSSSPETTIPPSHPAISPNVAARMEGMASSRGIDEKNDEILFRHGASPFRVAKEAPPKFSFEHIWGMVKWGRKAGAWGKGIEGLGEREKDREKGRG